MASFVAFSTSVHAILAGSESTLAAQRTADIRTHQEKSLRIQLETRQFIHTDSISESEPKAEIDILVKTARLQEEAGNLAAAEKSWEKAAEIAKTNGEEPSEKTAYILACLGRVKWLLEKYQEAELTKIKAIRQYEALFGDQDLRTSFEYQALGVVYYSQKNWEKAEYYFNRALIASEGRSDSAARRQSILTKTNLAALYASQGKLDEAKRTNEEALEEMRNPDLNDPALRAANLQHLGNIYRKIGLREQALEAYTKSITSAKQMQGDSQGIKISSEDALAALQIESGKLGGIKERLTANLEELKRIGREKTNDYARLLTRLAYINKKEKDAVNAEAYYREAISIYERNKADKYEKGMATMDLALMKARQGQRKEAFILANTGIQNLIAAITLEAPLRRIEEREELAKRVDNILSNVFSFARDGKEGASLAMLTRLNRQGRLAEIERIQNELWMNPEKRALIKEYRQISEDLGSNLLSPEQQISLLQKRASIHGILFRELKPNSIEPASAKDLASLLPKDGALIEYQKYHVFTEAGENDNRDDQIQYLALILKPDATITTIPLGQSSYINSLVRQGILATAANQTDAAKTWEKLSALIVKPLLPYLGRSKQLFISPDSELNRIPFTALATPDRPGSLLADIVQIRQITTGRELVRLREPSTNGSTSIVFANPQFDDIEPGNYSALNHSKKSNEDPLAPNMLLQKAYFNWSPLPESEAEGKVIAKLTSAKLATGTQASEKNLRQAKRPRILHIASHGNFRTNNDNTEDSIQVNDRNISAQGKSQGKDGRSQGQMISSIILAGANKPADDEDDNGYLTEKEVVDLDLQGTELVVLSACSTAEGVIQNGEGVYGLQRSLAVAGARSTLLSLWKVDDSATREFMIRFYKRLKAGEGRADALTAVQKEFRDGIPGHPEWKEHYYWAAWQLVGDWRPIQGL